MRLNCTNMKVAVIGAGCAGLVSARFCLDADYDCDVFEQTGLLGGVWNYTDRTDLDEDGLPIQTVMYKGLRTNLPKELMTLTNFRHPPQRQSFIYQPQVLSYLQKYADKFSLNSHIKYYSLIRQVIPAKNNRWKVKVEDVKTKGETTLEYDAVMVCNGHYTKISVPDIPGMHTFKGKQCHSNVYRVPDAYAGLKVLIVGAGPSGQDIALKVVDVAQKVIISHRFTFAIPIEMPDTVVQKPVVKEIDGNDVIFEDDTTESVDAIIYCTGYQYSFPFLTDECGIKIEQNWVHYLFKHVINVDHPTMGFIGICFQTCPFPICDLQARFFLSYLTNGFNLPSTTEMKRDIEDDLASKGWKKRQAHKLGDEQRKYCEDIARTGNIAPLPDVIHKLFCRVRRKRNVEDNFEIVDDNTYRQI